jgi:hypothetical protein
MASLLAPLEGTLFRTFLISPAAEVIETVDLFQAPTSVLPGPATAPG